MPLLFLDALPSRTRKGTILRLLVETGGLERQRIGKINSMKITFSGFHVWWI